MTSMIDRRRSAQRNRGRDADSPLEIPKKGWRDIAMRVFAAFTEKRIMLMAAGVTFYILLALVPTISAFVAIYGLFVDPQTALSQVATLEGIVPAGGLEIIESQMLRLTEQNSDALSIALLVSLLIALWSAGAGIRALFEALNAVYHETEKRNFFMSAAIAFVFTLGGTFAAVVIVGALFVIPAALAFLPLGGMNDLLVRTASYAAMILVILLGLAALYRWGPSRAQPKWRWITPGSLMSVVAAMVTSVAFSWYTTNLTDFDATYGSLGSIIGLLMWIWISVAIVILGGSLNSEIEHQTALDSTARKPSKPLGARGAYVADTIGRAAGRSPIGPIVRNIRQRLSRD